MWALLAPVLTTIFGDTGIIGQYLKRKTDLEAAREQYKIAIVNKEIEMIKTDAQQVSDRLNSTSQEFKQRTFWFICVPVIIQLIAPHYAELMWHNFNLMPEWFRTLFVSVYCSIWGLPIAKEQLGGMFASLGNALEKRREYKLEKARINQTKLADELRKTLFKQGMTQQQWDAISNAANNSLEQGN